MQPVSRAIVQAFYEAYAARDPARIATYLADDVRWSISGPVEVLTFCGEWQGKRAVANIFNPQVPQTFIITGFTAECVLVDGDRAAMLGQLSGCRRDDGRRITYRLAHFLRFEDGKVVQGHSLLDSFDAAEQALGHAIDVSQTAKAPDVHAAGNRIVI